jgi:cytochrome P450
MQENKLAQGTEDFLTPQDLQDLSAEFIFASHQTVASAFCTALIQLAQHPWVLEELRAELREREVGPDDIINHELLVSLPFLGHVMKEILRHTPPVAGVFRKAVRDVEIGVSIQTLYYYSSPKSSHSPHLKY